MLFQLAEEGRLRIVGATVIDQDVQVDACRKLRESGCRIFSDYREMLKDLEGQIDICLIPTPIHLHAVMSVAALEAGAHVLVEKPLAATVQEIRMIREAEAATGRFVAVGFQRAYGASTHDIKTRLMNGEIGEVTAIKGYALWRRPTVYYERNNWAGRLKAGDSWVLDSPMNNAVSHYLHVMLFLLGGSLLETARATELEGELYRAKKIESFDTGVLRAQTTAGASLYFLASHSSEDRKSPVIEIEGTAGRIRWVVGEYYEIESKGGEIERFECALESTARERMMQFIFKRLQTGEGFICDTQSGEAHTLCINGLHDASPIHEIGEEYLKNVTIAEGELVTIKEIEHWKDICFKDRLLFSETNCPWSRQGSSCSLENYTHFPSDELAKSSIDAVAG